jgi:hypothetical protein
LESDAAVIAILKFNFRDKLLQHEKIATLSAQRPDG